MERESGVWGWVLEGRGVYMADSRRLEDDRVKGG